MKPVLESYADARAFLAATEAFLLTAETSNGLPLGLAYRCIAGEYPGTRFWAIQEDGVRLAAMQTPGFPIVLSAGDAHAGSAMAEYLAELAPDLTCVTGPSALSQAFADAWCRRAGGRAKASTAMTLLAAQRIAPWRPTPGGRRTATLADLDLINDWTLQFAAWRQGVRVGSEVFQL